MTWNIASNYAKKNVKINVDAEGAFLAKKVGELMWHKWTDINRATMSEVKNPKVTKVWFQMHQNLNTATAQCS